MEERDNIKKKKNLTNESVIRGMKREVGTELGG